MADELGMYYAWLRASAADQDRSRRKRKRAWRF